MRDGAPLSLLLPDVDRFKLFNDRYGHQGGDGCLQAVASAVTNQVRRPGDLAARYGGEEVAVLLPGANAEGVASVTEQIRAAIEALGVEHLGYLPAGVAHGLVTLVDKDSQTFAARLWFEVESTSRDVSFCNRTSSAMVAMRQVLLPVPAGREWHPGSGPDCQC